MLVLPALAWFLGRLDLDEAARLRVVTLATWGYAAAIGAALALSLLG